MIGPFGRTAVRGIKVFWEASYITETSLKGAASPFPINSFLIPQVIAPFHTHSRHGRSTTANTARACTTFFQSWAEQTHYLHKVLHGALVVCWSHGKLITNSAFLFGCSFFSNTFILVRFVLVSQPYRWDLLSYPIRLVLLSNSFMLP